MKTPIISSPIIIAFILFINYNASFIYAQNKDFSKHNANNFQADAYEEQTATKVDTALINKYFQMSRNDLQPKVTAATYNITNITNNLPNTTSNQPNYPNNRSHNYYKYNYGMNVVPYLNWNVYNGWNYGTTLWINGLGWNRHGNNCWR